ncbi:MAG: acetyl-CoA carboxylase biotin carboxyl carrier protein subunit [Bacteriovoracaceae bacterium]|mgnify:CR=1 FL=1|jgi:acetyl/propionyl-CoA carboxylase alpha subunit|nr:acetyl-CoA carboxylase biotin carboxyl carrier protein subunit [Bacteriovoracaceae bacterium]
MRYYLVNDNREISIDIVEGKRLSKEMVSFKVNYLEDFKIKFSKDIFIRNLANRFFLSTDRKSWKLISRLRYPERITFVDQIYDLFRGFKPSGMSSGASGELKTQMPGKIVKILVKKGEVVAKGQPLLIMEAMKMENELKSGIDGKITDIYVHEGQALESGVSLMEISDKENK